MLHKYMYKFPKAFYALGPFMALNMSDARAILRNSYNFTRLPNGTEVWRSDGKIK